MSSRGHERNESDKEGRRRRIRRRRQRAKERKKGGTYHLLIWDPCASVDFSEMA